MYPLAEGCFAPKNQWYIAAWSHEVTRDAMERWVLDEPIAFYRTESGQAVALQGRCPHRHFPLGKSRVVGDAIECLYHGITFDQQGECVRIPSQDMIPKSCRVKAYPVVERWQWLWIWMGDPMLADESLIPDHHAIGLTDPDYQVDAGTYFEVPGRYMLMHDNLFDLTHLGFLHKTSIGAGDFGTVDEIRDNGSNWISSDRVFNGIECPALYADIFDYHDTIDRRFGMKLYLPCLHVGYDHFFRADDGRPDDERLLGKVGVYHAITPATKHTAHYFFVAGRTFHTSDTEFGKKMLDGLRAVIDEDLIATREIETMLTRKDDELPAEVLLKADATCVRGRRLFEDLIRKEQDNGASVSAAKR